VDATKKEGLSAFWIDICCGPKSREQLKRLPDEYARLETREIHTMSDVIRGAESTTTIVGPRLGSPRVTTATNRDAISDDESGMLRVVGARAVEAGRRSVVQAGGYQNLFSRRRDS
jgi:hypothetical protein